MLKNQSGKRDFLVKPTVLLLVFLFSIMPIAPALAELSADSAAASIVESASDPAGTDSAAVSTNDTTGADNTLENLIDADNSDKTKEPVNIETLTVNGKSENDAKTNKDDANKKDESNLNTAELSSLSLTPTSLGQANVTKSSRINIDVDTLTGALIYSYDFVLPPGRNNITPDVSLKYNSEDKNNASEFGYGWSLSIPKIERINKHGAESLYIHNYFNSSLSGELNLIGGNAWGAKIENGEYFPPRQNLPLGDSADSFIHLWQ